MNKETVLVISLMEFVKFVNQFVGFGISFATRPGRPLKNKENSKLNNTVALLI